MKTFPSKSFVGVVGLVVGLFLASEGFLFYFGSLSPVTEVKVVTVTKTKHVPVIKVVERVVEKQVTVREIKNKLYRATLVDAKGNDVQSWEVTKCRFVVIGAQLTDQTGKTFSVAGQIKIEPIK